MNNEETSNGSFAWILALPFLLIIFILTIAGYWLAKAGAKFRLVQLFIMPACFFLSNFIAVLLVLPSSFVYGLFTGKKETTQWLWSHIGDLTVFPIWGRVLSWFYNFGLTDFSIAIPWATVIGFQLIVFVGIGYRLSRHMTCTLLDVATAVNARNGGVDPYTARMARAAEDRGYMSAVKHYNKGGKPPLMGFFGVALVGTMPDDMYRFLPS